MAEDATKNAADEGERGGKGKSRLKTAVVVVALLAIEAAAILGGIRFLGSGPDAAQADVGQLDPEQLEREKIVEIQVLDSKLPNARTGVSYLYGTEIYVQVKKKHEAAVEDKVTQFYNELKAEITAIWRTSDPGHFQEPKLETLTRKVHAMLNDRFDVDNDGDPIIQKVVIVMGTGFRVDR